MDFGVFWFTLSSQTLKMLLINMAVYPKEGKLRDLPGHFRLLVAVALLTCLPLTLSLTLHYSQYSLL
ncbi:hypothetical protein BDQ12DRAFT_677121 [Crucibulum laeve]|uniref:Uncharacterized protein n=1 Tax=Crucibulum laeve TaxID=68775 RepID=A0A5C3MGF2_9AGAR|nr:hypothetical protein BDQ12DRAFT_677121 [Crucibulum laeve]